MKWRDEGVIIAVRPYGETSAIVEAITRRHGRHLGYVRGGASSKRLRGVLARGNHVNLHWQARLESHLGMFQIELEAALAMRLMDDRGALAALDALCAELVILPERQPYERVFVGLAGLLPHLSGADRWRRFARFELALLAELGFGLDAEARAELPAFLTDADIKPSASDMREGLHITAELLAARLYRPHGEALPKARLALLDHVEA